MFGKSLELVCFLRKKDDVVYDKFVEILKQKRGSQDRLVDIMTKKRVEIGTVFISRIKTHNVCNIAFHGYVIFLILKCAVVTKRKYSLYCPYRNFVRERGEGYLILLSTNFIF